MSPTATTAPEAVFLDVGWTLVYPRRSMWEVFSEVVHEAGGRLSAGEAERLVYDALMRHREQTIAEFRPDARYPDSDEHFEALFVSMARLVFDKAGVSKDPEPLSREFLYRFWLLGNWTIFPEVRDAMERLRRRGIRLGVVSNASSDLVGFLDEVGLASLLDFVLVSAVEGTRKPDRRIFERALALADVPPSAAVHVGDMYVEDILGARNAGIRPFLMDRGPNGMFPNFPESANHAPDAIETVRDLNELLDAVGID